MANNLVFNYSADDLKTLMHGANSSGATKTVLTDDDGKLLVGGTSSVNVANTPSVKIDNTPSVKIHNTPSVNVENTPSVKIDNTPTVKIGGRGFTVQQDKSGSITGTGSRTGIDISEYASNGFFIRNTNDASTVVVSVQISPNNNADYYVAAAGAAATLVNEQNAYLEIAGPMNYARLNYSVVSGNASLDIYYCGQN